MFIDIKPISFTNPLDNNGLIEDFSNYEILEKELVFNGDSFLTIGNNVNYVPLSKTISLTDTFGKNAQSSFVSKILSSLQPIAGVMSNFLSKAVVYDYNKTGLLTSKVWNEQSSEAGLSINISFIIENKAKFIDVTHNKEKRYKAEKEFEKEFSKILFFSLYKLSESNTDIEKLLKEYNDLFFNHYINGIDINTYTATFFSAAIKRAAMSFGTYGSRVVDVVDEIFANSQEKTTTARDIDNFGSFAKEELDYIKQVGGQANNINYAPLRFTLRLYNYIENSKIDFINFTGVKNLQSNDYSENYNTRYSVLDVADSSSLADGLNKIKQTLNSRISEFVLHNINFRAIGDGVVRHHHRKTGKEIEDVYFPSALKVDMSFNSNRNLLMHEFASIFVPQPNSTTIDEDEYLDY